MKAVTPVLPSSPQFKEIVLAKDQKEYFPLPVAVIGYQDTTSLISCYKLSLRERMQILFSGKVWWEQLTFGKRLQPQKMYVSEPLKACKNA
jgi:hypothetical protein